jgi:N-acyl-D-glutamate deacylase
MSCRSGILASTLIFSALACSPGLAQDYDLVIVNGRVMDPETLYDGIANVGVTDGRIVAISTDPLTGAETVDASRSGLSQRASRASSRFRKRRGMPSSRPGRPV